jgi:uncharacterized membrane protein
MAYMALKILNRITIILILSLIAEVGVGVYRIASIKNSPAFKR